MLHDVMVVGSGGREHSLVWKLSQSPKINQLYVAPGNAGTRQIAQNVPIDACDIRGLINFVEARRIYLTVVGPENPLALGVVDEFQRRGLRIFGPSKAASWIEKSKAWAKLMMVEEGIPTALHRTFRSYRAAYNYVHKVSFPLVLKASGLAVGKGVVICYTFEEAVATLKAFMLDKIFEESGEVVVIEQFLTGREVSLHALSDGENFLLFPPTQDRKDYKGKNTGGMGVIGPLDWLSPNCLNLLGQKTVQPALNFMRREGTPFVGCLYPGLMLTAAGAFVLEFNCRFGDPETQVYMRLLLSDLFDLIEATLNKTIATLKVEWFDGYGVCIILASKGYPGEYEVGIPIFGVEEAESLKDVVLFHSGTQFKDCLRTSSGRVIGVTAIGKTLEEAVEKGYDAVEKIHFEGRQYLDDIGKRS